MYIYMCVVFIPAVYRRTAKKEERRKRAHKDK